MSTLKSIKINRNYYGTMLRPHVTTLRALLLLQGERALLSSHRNDIKDERRRSVQWGPTAEGASVELHGDPF